MTRNLKFEALHNAMRLLCHVDGESLRKIGVQETDRQRIRRNENPMDWFIHLPEGDAEKVFTELIEPMQPPRLQFRAVRGWDGDSFLIPVLPSDLTGGAVKRIYPDRMRISDVEISFEPAVKHAHPATPVHVGVDLASAPDKGATVGVKLTASGLVFIGEDGSPLPSAPPAAGGDDDHRA